ncbi:MAG: hypothetical protein ACE5MB_03055 [Anaerolineae bacterium]
MTNELHWENLNERDFGVNMDEFIAKSKEIYLRIREELESKHEGEIVAIDPESGDYFLGRTLGEADERAFAKYPDKLLCFVRIGAGVVMPLKTW